MGAVAPYSLAQEGFIEVLVLKLIKASGYLDFFRESNPRLQFRRQALNPYATATTVQDS